MWCFINWINHCACFGWYLNGFANRIFPLPKDFDCVGFHFWMIVSGVSDMMGIGVVSLAINGIGGRRNLRVKTLVEIVDSRNSFKQRPKSLRWWSPANDWCWWDGHILIAVPLRGGDILPRKSVISWELFDELVPWYQYSLVIIDTYVRDLVNSIRSFSVGSPMWLERCWRSDLATFCVMGDWLWGIIRFWRSALVTIAFVQTTSKNCFSSRV